MQPEHLAIAVLIYLLLNLLVFSIYWWDKQAAIDGGWRVRESTLLTLAFIGGSFGAVAAQRVLRHKTCKEPFRTILAMIAALHVFLGTFVGGIWLLAPQTTISAMLS